MKRMRWISIALVLVVLAGLGIWFDHSRKKAAQALGETAYEESVVARGDIVQSISADGIVELSDQVNVRPLITGKVKALYVKVGDKVEQGQLMLTLDDTDARSTVDKAREALVSAKANLAKAQSDFGIVPSQLEAEVEAARASVKSAEAQLAELKKGTKTEELDQQRAAVNQARISRDSKEADYKRTKELFASGVVSRQEFESGEAAYLTAVESAHSAERRLDQLLAPPDSEDLAEAEAALAKAKASLRLAQANLAAGSSSEKVAAAKSELVNAQTAYDDAKEDLDATRVTAPISGSVIELSLKYNQTSSELKVGDTITPETGVLTIANPSTAEVTAYVDETDIAGVQVGQAAIVTADAYEGRELKGQVTSIAPSGSTTDNVVTFDVTVSGSEISTLKPGMTADAEIIVARRQDVLLVPKEAIVTRRGQTMVQVASPGGNKFKRVEVGLEDDTMAQILSGLSEGDKVLVAKAKSEKSESDQGRPRGFGGPPM